MIYLFIYLTAASASSSSRQPRLQQQRLRLRPLRPDVQGFLQEYSGMYQTALQKAQDYLKPREHTIDYHYSPAKVCCIPSRH